MRLKLARKYAPSRYTKTEQQYRLKVWYPSQKKFIIVGHGTRQEITSLASLYTINDSIKIELA